MAKILSLLFLLTINLLGINNVKAANECYWTGSGYNSSCYACLSNSGYPEWWKQQYCTGYAAPTCQARAETKSESCPINYSGSVNYVRYITCANPYQEIVGSWQLQSNTCVQNPPTCQVSTETKTESCGAHYTGQKTYTKTNTCPNPYGSQVQGQWTLTSNTCVQEAPTCKTSSETQTLSCPTGYTGSITQTRTSSCPDPYGQPVFTPWATTTNTCVKSVTNVSNPVSPISPISPISSPQVVTLPAPTVTQPTATVDSTPTPTTQTTTTTTSSTSASTTQSAPATAGTSAQTSTSSQQSTPKGKTLVPGLGLALSLDVLNKPAVSQYNSFPAQIITQDTRMFDGQRMLNDYLVQPAPVQKPINQWNPYE